MEVFGGGRNVGYAYSYEQRAIATLKLVREVSSAGARILDVAAAQGNFTLRMAEGGYRVTWNDLRSELQPYVRSKHERGDVEYRPGNILELRFDTQFDTILVAEVIEHVAHPDQFLAAIVDLVKPGGHIVLTTPNGAYFRNRSPRFSETRDPAIFESMQFQPDADGHIFLLHDDEIAALAAFVGLEVCSIQFLVSPILKGALGLAAVTRYLPRWFIKALDSLVRLLPGKLRRVLLMQLVILLKKPHHP